MQFEKKYAGELVNSEEYRKLYYGFYNQVATEHINVIDSDYYPLQEIRNSIKQRIGPGKILDLCAGDGYNNKKLELLLGRHIDCFDVNASENSAVNKLDANAIPLGNYPSGLLLWTFMHLNRPREILSWYKQALMPKGKLYVDNYISNDDRSFVFDGVAENLMRDFMKKNDQVENYRRALLSIDFSSKLKSYLEDYFSKGIPIQGFVRTNTIENFYNILSLEGFSSPEIIYERDISENTKVTLFEFTSD